MSFRTMKLTAAICGAALTATVLVATPASAKSPRAAFPKTMAGAPMYGPIESYRNGPTVLGPMMCDPVNNPRAPLPRTRWVASYWDGSDDTDKLTADAVVTTWRAPRAAFRDVVRNTGRCAFLDSKRIAWPGQDPTTHALFANDLSVSAVIRDGRRVVAVDVVDWNGDFEPGDPDQKAAAIKGALSLAAAL